ncbi:MAG: glycosyltransferase, partial [Clostridia bacterium]|nr:glycosyltransferase [Clostridia bacterium]
AGFHSGFVTKKVIGIIEQEKPDIVHLHHLESYFINIERLVKYLKEKHVTTVWTLHDCWPFTGHCTHFLTANCDKWKTQCEKCPQKKKYPYSLIFDRSKKLYSLKKELLEDWEELHIVNVSKWMDSITRESFLSKHPTEVIYNGIDVSAFSPSDTDCKSELGFAGKRVVLGVASSWGESKGLDYFIELSKAVDENTVIVLVGMDKDRIKKLPAGVIGVLRTSSKEELRKYYCAADVFLNLSLEETMGLVTVEALACGTPVIVCNSSASPELVGDGCGIVLEERTVPGIVDAISEIVSHGKAFYGENARSFVLNNFAEDIMKKNYYDLYCKIGKENE